MKTYLLALVMAFIAIAVDAQLDLEYMDLGMDMGDEFTLGDLDFGDGMLEYGGSNPTIEDSPLEYGGDTGFEVPDAPPMPDELQDVPQQQNDQGIEEPQGMDEIPNDIYEMDPSQMDQGMLDAPKGFPNAPAFPTNNPN